MQKVNIPKTDLRASPLALGTDYFGSTVSRERSMQLMDHYFEAGGNVFDTAEFYARWIPGGEHQSERVIGKWLRDRGVRDHVILSTKGAHPRLETMEIPRMSKTEIQADLDSSLQRLGVERVDLYWLHRDAPGYPVEEILQSLDAFRQAGKIRYAGFSNWTQARADEARQAAERLGIQGFVASQNMWSLAKADLSKADPTWAYIDEPFGRWHIEHGLAAFPYLTQVFRDRDISDARGGSTVPARGPLFETSSMELLDLVRGFERYHLHDPVPVEGKNRCCAVGADRGNCLILGDIHIVRRGQDPLGKACSRSSRSLRVHVVGSEEEVMSISGRDRPA
jgi:aryl-alcohol dehydrogenase-like predicted oxidoreductase